MTPNHTLKSEILAEIRELYPNLPDEFHLQSITTHVSFRIRNRLHKEPFDDTINRYFRQLKSELNYTCTNKQKSQYKKS